MKPAQRGPMVETVGEAPDSQPESAGSAGHSRAGPYAQAGAFSLQGTQPGAIPGLAADAEQDAFTLSLRLPSAIPVLIAVPHAGRTYPEALTAMLRAPEQACTRLEDRLIDLVAEAVARETGSALLVAHAPRAMIDLNRAPEDIDWDMVEADGARRMVRHAAGRRARSGLGLVPRRLPGHGELWKRRLSGHELSTRLAQVHQPYHAALSAALEGLRDQWGAALLIDLHSMPPLGQKRGANPAPDFVIGDRFGAACDPALALAAVDHLDAHRRRAAHNRPYAGGYVLDRHAAPARGIHALQVEVCRSAYLDASLREPGPGMEATSRVLAGLVRRLADELAVRSGGARPLRHAAE